MIDPFLKEVNSLVEILSPGGKRFHGEESFLIPKFGDLVIEERVGDQFQFLAHDDKSDECLFDINQVFSHDLEESVVSNNFLH